MSLTYPYQVSSGTNIVPFSSGTQNLGSTSLYFGNLYVNRVVQTGTSGGGITGPATTTNSGIAIWGGTNGASLLNSKWTINNSVLAPTTSGSQYLGSFGPAGYPINNITVNRISGNAQVAKAWVCWDQANGTPTISGSFNVSSLTDGGAGLTTVLFTTPMPDIRYAVAGDTGVAAGTYQILMPNILFTTGVKCTISNTATLNDNKINCLAVLSNP